MNLRIPSVMSGNVNGPSLSASVMNSSSGPMMDSGVPMLHPNQYALAGMIQHGNPHLHERELMIGSGMPVGPMGPGPHGALPHLGPHLIHPHHPHHNHPNMQIARINNPYMVSVDSKLNEFNRRLQQRTEDCDNIWWDTLITEFFEEDAVLTVTFTDEGPKRYTIGRTLIPRYFRSIFDSGCSEYYYFLRMVRESYHTSTIVLDSDSAQMVMTFPRTMPPTTITVEGRLMLDFNFDDLMRIRSWTFQIRSHREFILRSMPGFGCNQEQMLMEFSKNATRCGIPNFTMHFFRICSILEPMQELMSRQKAYSLSPKDCLKTTLFQKWQRMVAPPGQQQKSESSRQTNKRRKRKGSNANSDSASGRGSKRKQSPVPSLPNLNQPGDVMIVGEPTLMGGEFGDEDERSITRLENTQYEASSNNAISGPILSHGQQTTLQHLPNMSGPHLAAMSIAAASSINNCSGSGGGGSQQYSMSNQEQQQQHMSVYSTNHSSDSKTTLDMPPIAVSNLNGSLNNLLKSEARINNYFYQSPSSYRLGGGGNGCNAPSAKMIPCSQEQQQQQQMLDDQASIRSLKNGGPPRPTSQDSNQMPGFQDGIFGFTTDNLMEFSEKTIDLMNDHQRPISEPLPMISGHSNADTKICADM